MSQVNFFLWKTTPLGQFLRIKQKRQEGLCPINNKFLLD